MMPAENPYAASMGQPEEIQQQPAPQANLFDDNGEGEEEEYKPQEVEAEQNPYAQEQIPMGFGAERANLMGEAAVQMPYDNSAAGSSLNN